MWSYEKRLQFPVRIKTPNAAAAKVIITQYGGPDGELGASMRYLSQRYTLDTQVHSVFIPHLRRTKRQVQRREQRAAAQRLGHRIDLFKALHRHCGNGQMAAAALPCVLQVVFVHGLQSLLSVDRGAGRKHPAACSMV